LKLKSNSILAIILLTIPLLTAVAGCSYEDFDDPEDAGNYNQNTNVKDQNIYRDKNTSLVELAEHGDYLVLAYFEVDRGELLEAYLPELDDDLFDYYTDFLEYSYDELVALQEDLYAADILWDAVSGIFPRQYLNQIAYFEFFTDGTDDFLGAIEEVDSSQDAFIFSLDYSDMFYSNGELNHPLLIDTITHELAHIITLGPDQVAWVEEEDSNPATYYIFEYDLDTEPDSYINQFYNNFWKDIHGEWAAFYYEYGVLYEGDEDMHAEYQEIVQDYIDDFYYKYEDRFLTDYAATSPTEDIAESFMIFALQEKPQGRRISDHKALFFYDYPELVEVRNHIQEYVRDLY
jgi:hypothetical protein